MFEIRHVEFLEGRSLIVETFFYPPYPPCCRHELRGDIEKFDMSNFWFIEEGCSMALEGAIVAISLVPPVLSNPSVLSDFSDQIISS